MTMKKETFEEKKVRLYKEFFLKEDVFFNALKGDQLLDTLDPTATDRELGKIDPSYDPEKCTWDQGGITVGNISTSKYIYMKYGENRFQIFTELLE